MGYSTLADAWVDDDKVRVYRPQKVAAGTKVDIKWGSVWYPGSIVRSALGMHLAHYDACPSGDDEWVPLGRLRLK